MKKLNHNRVLNIVAALLFAFSLMCGSALQVSAYTADTSLTGYPFVYDDFDLGLIYRLPDYPYEYTFNPTLDEQNSYKVDIHVDFGNVDIIRIGNVYGNYIIPYSNDLYDYYFVGTYAFTNFTNFNFKSKNAEIYTVSNGTLTGGIVSNFNSMPYKSNSAIGESFYFKFEMDSNANFVSFDLKNEVEYGGYIPQSTMWFSGSVIPIPKGTEADQLNQSILNELVKINQNLITANTLQQQTIDAIKDHDTNVGNWFNTLTNNLGSWFQQLYTSMGVGFEKLYKQMTEEQTEQLEQDKQFHDEEMEQSSEQHDEALHGFDASDGNDASGNLENSLGSMEEIESGITDKAFEGMDEYTIPEEGVTGYAQQFLTTFPLVAAMMQSIYDSSGPFNILLSVTFTFVLVSILIGLYRFYKD